MKDLLNRRISLPVLLMVLIAMFLNACEGLFHGGGAGGAPGANGDGTPTTVVVSKAHVESKYFAFFSGNLVAALCPTNDRLVSIPAAAA